MVTKKDGRKTDLEEDDERKRIEKQIIKILEERKQATLGEIAQTLVDCPDDLIGILYSMTKKHILNKVMTEEGLIWSLKE